MAQPSFNRRSEHKQVEHVAGYVKHPRMEKEGTDQGQQYCGSGVRLSPLKMRDSHWHQCKTRQQQRVIFPKFQRKNRNIARDENGVDGREPPCRFAVAQWNHQSS